MFKQTVTQALLVIGFFILLLYSLRLFIQFSNFAIATDNMLFVLLHPIAALILFGFYFRLLGFIMNFNLNQKVYFQKTNKLLLYCSIAITLTIALTISILILPITRFSILLLASCLLIYALWFLVGITFGASIRQEIL
ncbi:putative membrane protein [Paenibacillus shirakamiensis]|uniref:Membrane protein n=1 Tax=Paenibacillus shirakamiensis TaxID=1265935 RepID=A0ABS4JMK8_9BACL|nr:putative membrane protein [Paenibacillus shirakamiensis]